MISDIVRGEQLRKIAEKLGEERRAKIEFWTWFFLAFIALISFVYIIF